MCNSITVIYFTISLLLQIKFNCPLSQTVTKQISVSNPTDNIVNYLLLLANDVNHFFTVLKPVSVLHLNAHGSGQIQIQFHARKIRKNRGETNLF